MKYIIVEAFGNQLKDLNIVGQVENMKQAEEMIKIYKDLNPSGLYRIFEEKGV